VLLGLAGALAASRAMGSFLYDVPPTDPLSVAAACGIVALWWWARRWPPRGGRRTPTP
jgi:hypothetical protein